MTAATVDMAGRYRISGFGAVAFYLVGYATITTEEEWVCIGDESDEDDWIFYEPEEIPNLDMVRAVMVGDDHEWTVDVDDLTPIGDDDYCSCCGQIGCGWS